jgi:hypothetical protein
MRPQLRRALRLALSISTTAAPVVVSATISPVAGAVTSHWVSCNDNAIRETPRVVWWRMQGVSDDHTGVPSNFWTGYRDDLAKVVCYESTFQYHAHNAGQYGWFQMNQALINSEGVTWSQYWYGDRRHPAGWYQCLAAERYILHRYGNPAAAWAHERYYGWY